MHIPVFLVVALRVLTVSAGGHDDGKDDGKGDHGGGGFGASNPFVPNNFGSGNGGGGKPDFPSPLIPGFPFGAPTSETLSTAPKSSQDHPGSQHTSEAPPPHDTAKTSAVPSTNAKSESSIAPSPLVPAPGPQSSAISPPSPPSPTSIAPSSAAPSSTVTPAPSTSAPSLAPQAPPLPTTATETANPEASPSSSVTVINSVTVMPVPGSPEPSGLGSVSLDNSANRGSNAVATAGTATKTEGVSVITTGGGIATVTRAPVSGCGKVEMSWMLGLVVGSMLLL